MNKRHNILIAKLFLQDLGKKKLSGVVTQTAPLN
jgi:hypothetical protein